MTARPDPSPLPPPLPDSQPGTDQATDINQHAARAHLADLAHQLDTARQHAGLSRRDLARHSGLARQTLDRLATGTGAASYETLARAAIAVGHRLEITPARPDHRPATRRPPTLPTADSRYDPTDPAATARWLVRLAGIDILTARRRAAKTAAAVAVDAGFATPETLWRWEHGHSPNLHTAITAALSLGQHLTLLPIADPWRPRPRRPAPATPTARPARQAATRTSLRQDWATPDGILAELHTRYGPFALDAAAAPATTIADAWLGPQHHIWARRDALAHPHWADLTDRPGPVYLNPPFSTPHATPADWYQRARTTAQAGRTVIALLPLRADTHAWHHHIWNIATVEPIAGRLRYHHPHTSGRQAPFPSAIVTWTP